METRHQGRRMSRVVALEPVAPGELLAPPVQQHQHQGGTGSKRHGSKNSTSGGGRDILSASGLSVGSRTTDHSSARVSRNSRHQRPSRHSHHLTEPPHLERKPKVVEMAIVHFVYGEAVEKAIRRGYKTSALPPLTAATGTTPDGAGYFRRRENTYIISGVPDIFHDLVATRQTRKRNVERERAYRKLLPDLGEVTEPVTTGTGLSRMRLKLAAASGVLLRGAANRARANLVGNSDTIGTGTTPSGIGGNKLPTLLLNRARQLTQSNNHTQQQQQQQQQHQQQNSSD